MATRIIKMIDGQLYSGGAEEFTEYHDYVEYNNFTTTTKIYKRGIVLDSINQNLIEAFPLGIVLTILLLIAFVIIILPPANPPSSQVETVLLSPGPSPLKHRRLHSR